MTGHFVTYDEAYDAFGEAAIAITAIGVLADRAVRGFSAVAHPGPSGKFLAVKKDGNDTAAYWDEGAAHWAAAHPWAQVTTMRASEYGWPEFLIGDSLHVRVERIHRPNASARRTSRQHQGPDAHLAFMTLFDAVNADSARRAPTDLTKVDLTATFNADGLIDGATISAPMGEQLLWRWEVTGDEVTACIAKWRSLGNTPWLYYIDLLSTLEPRVAAASTPLAIAPLPAAGRRFDPTEKTQTPAEAGVTQEEAAERRSGLGGDTPS